MAKTVRTCRQAGLGGIQIFKPLKCPQILPWFHRLKTNVALTWLEITAVSLKCS